MIPLLILATGHSPDADNEMSDALVAAGLSHQGVTSGMLVRFLASNTYIQRLGIISLG